jgi:hypothetical protein
MGVQSAVFEVKKEISGPGSPLLEAIPHLQSVSRVQREWTYLEHAVFRGILMGWTVAQRIE